MAKFVTQYLLNYQTFPTIKVAMQKKNNNLKLNGHKNEDRQYNTGIAIYFGS